ncbi:uncharacterized protein LOC109541268 [Dendroctonus ponderosae]|uniref:uncharacterized protein LOC109541268 n=1 Tax=Dendroctonus ponderosae TaxID=77166 RepID=UPI002034F4ED|nr:uncharacterized protein LOC109541268 [Dendroctonus ponderosae]
MLLDSGKDCVSVILVLFIQNFLGSEAIECYKCAFAPYIYFTNESSFCKDFDHSNRFIVDCPYSTFCVKKNTYAIINGVSINGTERDCASQKLDTQRLSNGKWHPETRVEEPYEEGCKANEDKGLRTAYVEHCYCRGELCNSGKTVFEFGLFTILLNSLAVHQAVGFMFL